GQEVRVFIGPIDSVYILYWSDVSDDFAKERAISLMLFNPIWNASFPDKLWHRGDAVDEDFATVKTGMTLDRVSSILGPPLTLAALSNAGFSAEFVIWSKKGPMKNWRSRVVTLEFSRFRVLQRIELPNNSLHRTARAPCMVMPIA